MRFSLIRTFWFMRKLMITFPKHLKAKNLLNSLQQEIIISVQVLNELYISLNKIIKNDIEIKNILQSLILDCRVVPITLNTSVKAWEIKERYKFSFWDVLLFLLPWKITVKFCILRICRMVKL